MVTASNDVNSDMQEYIVSLREGIMDAWGGILLSYKGTPQGKYFLGISLVVGDH